MSYLSEFGYDEVYFNELLSKVITSDPIINQYPSYQKALLDIMMSGGKRIRPLFVLLAADLNPDRDEKACYLAAVAVELLHVSSLIHDDIIDQSNSRHHIQTLHKAFDTTTALRLGNFTLNKSLELFSMFKHRQLHEEIAKTMNYLCLGELNQQQDHFNFNLSIEDYLYKSYQKTGSLLSLSLMIGGYVADLELSTIHKLSEIGCTIGIAYQLKDDILDFTSHRSHIGKPVGYDLRNGIITLPTLFALDDDLLREDLLSLEADTETSKFDSICDKIKESHHIQKANDLCLAYVMKSKELIQHLPVTESQLLQLLNLIFN